MDILKICAAAALSLMAGCAGTADAKAKRPCARIEFDPMPQLMRFGDTAQRDETRPFAKDPTVIRHNGRYLMYYSVNYDPKNYPHRLPKGKNRSWWGAVAESTDLVNWKRICDIEPVGSPDFTEACVAPCVKKIDGKIHMFSQGKVKGGNRNSAIWHATSEDGVTFTLDGKEPVFRPANKWSIDRAIDAENRRVGITHGDCPEEAAELAKRVCEIAKPKDLIIVPHEPFTGAHVGPGMLALYFFGDER